MDQIRRSQPKCLVIAIQIVFFLISVCGVGCRAKSNELTVAEVDQIKRAVSDALDAFEAAERARDADALIELIDTEFYMYQDGRRVDYATVIDQMRTTLPSLQKFEANFEDVEVMVLGRESAAVSMVFHDVITDANGETTRMWGPTTFIWRLRDGQWRMVYADSDHYSND